MLEEAGRLNYAATKSRRGRAPKPLMRAAAAERLTPAQQLEDPFYLYLRGYVEQACLDQRIALQALARRREGFAPPEGAVDGVVAIGRFTRREAEDLAAVSPNVVFLNASPDESRFDSVVLNYDLGIRLAVDYLLGLATGEWASSAPHSALTTGGSRRRRSAGSGSWPTWGLTVFWTPAFWWRPLWTPIPPPRH